MTSIQDVLDKNFGPLNEKMDRIHSRMQLQAEASERERLKTRKPIRFPLLNGAASAGALSMGGDVGEQLIGPDSGFVWSVRELNIEGLTAGATPDVVNFYRNSSAAQGKIFWQLNGNVFCQTFGRGEKLLFAGEHLFVVSVGTFAATGNICVSGMAEQVSAERIGEFY